MPAIVKLLIMALLQTFFVCIDQFAPQSYKKHSTPSAGAVIFHVGRGFSIVVIQTMLSFSLQRALMKLFIHKVRKKEIDQTLQQHSYKVLHANFPPSIVSRFITSMTLIQDEILNGTVMHATLEGFQYESYVYGNSSVIIDFLDTLFTQFDKLVEAHKCQKVKSCHNHYVVVSSVEKEKISNSADMASLAIKLLDVLCIAIQSFLDQLHKPELFTLKIGLASGRYCAGVVGSTRISYDIFGEAACCAASLASSSKPWRIRCLESMTKKLYEQGFRFRAADPILIEGRGFLETCFLSRTDHENPCDNFSRNSSELF